MPDHHDPLTLRTARWDDLDAVARLTVEVCTADGDPSVAASPEDLAGDWKSDGFDPAQDAFLVETAGGRLVGYTPLMNDRDHIQLSGDLYVLPQFKARGALKALLDAMETRAQAHIQQAEPGRKVVLRITNDNRDLPGGRIFTQAGYSPVRYYWRMGIDLEKAPPAPVLPAGFEFRPFMQAENTAAVMQARNEAFQGNWGSQPMTPADFTHFYFEDPEYNPALWAVIWDGPEIAAFSINRYRLGIGWIRTLGVRPAWRGKGLGLALLHRSFDEFYRRGTLSIGLGVDAANPTGATQLYHKAGMRVVSEHVMFEKLLRPGE